MERLHSVYDAIDMSEPFFPVQYECIDIPSEHRIEISFYNILKDPVCMTNLYWPGQSGGGWMENGGIKLNLIVGQEKYALEEVHVGYSPGYAEYVLPGETLRTSISYDSFHLPETLFYDEKNIDFIPLAYRCVERNAYLYKGKILIAP
jgi:hypothetical protein